eukprot:6045346-Pyramimonas_sp.AAC.1
MGAWAVVLILYKGDECMLGGVMRGGLTECNAMGLTPACATSAALECMAVLQALFWVLAERPTCQVSVDSDSMGTMRAAEGTSLPSSDRDIAQLVG